MRTADAFRLAVLAVLAGLCGWAAAQEWDAFEQRRRMDAEYLSQRFSELERKLLTHQHPTVGPDA